MSKAAEKRTRQKARRRVEREYKDAAIRAKYGPARKPALVVVRSLETGDVVDQVDQSRFARKVYAESLEEQAKALGFAGYAAYLRSPYWQQLRMRVLERDEFRCTRCKTTKNLSVHHRHYGRLGDEPLRSLVTLCSTCHKKTHS